MTATAARPRGLTLSLHRQPGPLWSWVVLVTGRRPPEDGDYLVDFAAGEWLFLKLGDAEEPVRVVQRAGAGWRCSCVGAVCRRGAIRCRHLRAVRLIQEQGG